jgi:aminoglycoside phosphotransferase (APT) family kinase protein
MHQSALSSSEISATALPATTATWSVSCGGGNASGSRPARGARSRRSTRWRLASARSCWQQCTALVHGDYRLDNVVFDSARRVEAVLDWELCTLGDPLADVGWLLATWVLPGEDASFMISGTPTRLPGFPARDELLDRYAQRSGLDVTAIASYEAFSLWKLACIAEGIRARDAVEARGRRHTIDPRVSHQVVLLAERALARLGG